MTKKDHPLDNLIIKLAARPGGFAVADASGHKSKNPQKRCEKLIKAGLIFRARVTRVFVRYFTTQARAMEFLRTETEKGPAVRLSPRPSPEKLVPKKAVKIIMPAGVQITVTKATYEPLNMAHVLRDCAVGSARRSCHVRSGAELSA